MKSKEMYLNLVAQLISFGVAFAISFFVTPIIVREVGKETYGFLGMANSFVGYVTIITVALNSLAGRFVTISLHRGDVDAANRYFSSVFYADTLIVLALLLPALLFVLNLERFFDIPAQSVLDVKATFSLVFIGFFIQLMFSVFSVATFATNKLHLASIRTIEANLLRVTVIISMFFLFGPSIAFVALGMLAYYGLIAITNVCYTKKLLPQIRVSRRCFDWPKIKELLISGCWSSITALSNTLLEGLDLLISNLMLGATVMGTVSIVKTVPNMVYQCLYSVLGAFAPQITIGYAKGDTEGVLSYINYASKVASSLLCLPVAFIIVFGDNFFRLWLPSERADELWILSILSLGELLFAGAVVMMQNLFTVTNNLKKPALVTLLTGAVNTVVVFLLLKITDIGVFAIVSVSSVLAVLRVLLFNIPYSAKCGGYKARSFYKMALRSVLFLIIAVIIGFIIKAFVDIHSWLMLVFCAMGMCITAFAIVFIIFFNKQEKRDLKNLLKRKTAG